MLKQDIKIGKEGAYNMKTGEYFGAINPEEIEVRRLEPVIIYSLFIKLGLELEEQYTGLPILQVNFHWQSR